MVDLFSEGPIEALQGLLSPLLEGAFVVVTTLGSGLVLMALALLVYWLWDPRTGFLLGAVVLGSSALNGALKGLFAMPRPPGHLHLVTAYGPGFPSGHAQQTAAFWGAGGLARRGRWVVGAAAAVPLVALSRVVLGVHYVGDVLGGVAFGLAVGLLAVPLQRAGLWSKLRLSHRLLLAALLPGALLLLLPWGQGLLQIAGLLAGASVGHVLQEERVGLRRAGRPGAVALRLLLGLGALGAFYLATLPLAVTLAALPLYAAMGLVATLLLPWLFRRAEARLLP